jgi:hypothetical protein
MKLLPDEMANALKASGLPWRVATGSRHYKVIVGGKFVAILPKSPTARNYHGPGHRNALANIRRAIRELRRG